MASGGSSVTAHKNIYFRTPTRLPLKAMSLPHHTEKSMFFSLCSGRVQAQVKRPRTDAGQRTAVYEGRWQEGKGWELVLRKRRQRAQDTGIKASAKQASEGSTTSLA